MKNTFTVNKYENQEQAEAAVKQIENILKANKGVISIPSKITEEQKKEWGTFKMRISDETRDSHGEVILLSGWNFDRYMGNPIVLDGHSHYARAVGRTLELSVEKDGLYAYGVFAPTESGQEMRKLYEGGFNPATSVGAMPLERDEKDPSIITEVSLYEFSFVRVPANPNALDAMKTAGINVEMLELKGLLQKDAEDEEEEDTSCPAADCECEKNEEPDTPTEDEPTEDVEPTEEELKDIEEDEPSAKDVEEEEPREEEPAEEEAPVKEEDVDEDAEEGDEPEETELERAIARAVSKAMEPVLAALDGLVKNEDLEGSNTGDEEEDVEDKELRNKKFIQGLVTSIDNHLAKERRQ